MMGKRFTEIEKWSDPWYRRLSPLHKLAWQFLCDNCDAAGVIDLDSELADFQIGAVVDWEGFLRIAGDRIERLESGKFWIVGFIGFQYGKLSSACAGHNNVFKSLAKHNLESRVLTTLVTRVATTLKDKDKDKDKETDKEKEKDKSNVELIAASYVRLHPRSRPGAKELGKIRDRLKEGFSVSELTTAIDGCHASPFHSGQNETGRKHQGLELICRDSAHVNQFIELAGQVNAPVLSKISQVTAATVKEFLSHDTPDYLKGPTNGKP